MKDAKYAFMEVSSHSAQKRIGGLKFAGGIFTNLTRDHLDYHQTVDNYLKAKNILRQSTQVSFCIDQSGRQEWYGYGTKYRQSMHIFPPKHL